MRCEEHSMRILKKTLGITGIIALLLLTSCQKNNEPIKNNIHQNNVSDISENNFEYKLSTETVFDNDVISCDNLVAQYKDGFVFTGSVSHTNSEFLVLTGESGSTAEKSYFNPDTAETDVISMKKKDDIVYLLCGKEGKGSVTSFDQNGNQIEKTELDFYPIDFEISEKIYILNSSSLSSEIEVYSDKLVFEESIDVSYKSDGTTLYPYKIAVSSENEIYCVLSEINNRSATQIILAGNNKIVCRSVNDMDSVDDIFISSTGNIILAGRENGNCLIDELDKNGTIVSMSEIQNCDEIYGITKSDKIIFSNALGISAFYNDETEILIKSDDFEDNGIIACCMENDGCTAYLSNAFEKYNAVFITDQNNKIISEIRAESISSCFVQNDKVYAAGWFKGNRTVVIFDNGNIIDTGIELEDTRQSYKIGVLPSGEIIISGSNDNKFTVYSDTFEKESSVDINICVSGFFKNNDSLLCYDYENIYRFNEKYETEKINLNLNQFGDNMSFSSGNDEYDFLFSVQKGLYGYNLSENSAVLLIDYNMKLLSDVRSFIILKDKTILINSLWNICECQISDTDSGKESQKQKLTLAYDELGQGLNTLRKAVNTFNSESEQFEIEMKDYSSDENGTAQALLALDIASGKIPDIIMTDLLSENIVTFLKNDTLTDMNQFIEKDNELNRELFYQSVLDAFTCNDKLYSLPLTFTLFTGRTNDNVKTSTCSEQIDHITDVYNPDNYVVERMYINNISEIYLSEKLDFANRKNNLSEPDLMKIISFYRKYDDILNNSDYTDLQYKEIAAHGVFIESLESFYHNLLCDSRGVIMEDTGNYNELGYPGVTGLVRPNLCFSIIDKCENKDAAWEFIKICYKSLGESNSVYEDGLYASVELNTVSSFNGIPDHIEEKFNIWMEGKCINHILYAKLDELICKEIDLNPDVSDEELSHALYSKIKLYLSEIQ